MTRLIECLKTIFPKEEKVHIREVLKLAVELLNVQARRLVDAEGFIFLREPEPTNNNANESTAHKLKKLISELETEFNREELTPLTEIVNMQRVEADRAPASKIHNEEFKVKVIAFSGMVLGEYIAKQLPNCITVITNQGKVLKFDSKTLRQMNPKNPKFANRIEICS